LWLLKPDVVIRVRLFSKIDIVEDARQYKQSEENNVIIVSIFKNTFGIKKAGYFGHSRRGRHAEWPLKTSNNPRNQRLNSDVVDNNYANFDLNILEIEVLEYLYKNEAFTLAFYITF
jgi:hypothetical protein